MQRRGFIKSVGLVASGMLSNFADAASPTPASSADASVPTPPAATNVANAIQTAQATRDALGRIDALDRRGPCLRSVIELNPDALTIAAALDRERAAGKSRGPLHGVPLVIKDNIATGDRMSTTAGSMALDGVRATRDAELVRRLRGAGAVIVGKTNLSEWANIRSTRSTSGWSGRGGLTRNPYGLDRTASGSSSGSAVAVAAGLTRMAIGTETDGSIVSPASMCGVVGLKPTVGRVSRDGIVPISHTQDTAGPIAATVREAALLLSAIAAGGPDSHDPATFAAPAADDYLRGLQRDALSGVRLGVARQFFTGHDEVDQRIEQAIVQLKRLGAEIVDPVDLPHVGYGNQEQAVLLYEFKHDLPIWLDTFAPHAPIHTLADLIAFNNAHRNVEMPYFGQEVLIDAQALGGLDSKTYRSALTTCRTQSRDAGLDRVFRNYRLDAVIAPTGGTAWLTDLVNGDSDSGGFSTPAAVAGYPHLTVPAGQVRGLPVGLSFVGPAWSEARLLAFGYAFEQAGPWCKPPGYPAHTATPLAV